MIGAPNDGIILPEDTPPNCAANVACAIDSNSTQCTDVLGGSSFTTVVRTSYFGEPDENGCEVFRLTLTGDRVYMCGCNPSKSFPGCRFKFFTAAQVDKLVVPGGGSKPQNEPQNECENITSEKKCGKKAGGKCTWKMNSRDLGTEYLLNNRPEEGGKCIANEGGLGASYPIVASEAVVGANAIKQSNSGYGLNGQFSALAFVALMAYKVFN